MRKARIPAKEKKLRGKRKNTRHGTHLETLILTLAPKSERWLGRICWVHSLLVVHDAKDDFTCKWNEGAGRDEKREMMIRRDRERFGPRLDGKGPVWACRGEAEKLTETERGGEVPVKKERWRPKVLKFSAMATRWHCPPRVARLRSRAGLKRDGGGRSSLGAATEGARKLSPPQPRLLTQEVPNPE